MAMASGGAAKPRSMWWQAGPFEQWVQEVLISVLVPEGASVCELMCGSGKALGKWQRAKLTQYVGIGEGRHRTLLPLWPLEPRPALNHALNPAHAQMPRSTRSRRPSSGGRPVGSRSPRAFASSTPTW